MQKWEYFEVAFELPTDRYKNPLEPLDDKLNDFGEDGWELFELRRWSWERRFCVLKHYLNDLSSN